MRPPAPRLPDPGRLAEILVELGDGWSYGSGYEVAPGLVLTAAHVLKGRDRAIVRFDGGLAERELDGVVAWRPAGLDLALVDVGRGEGSGAPTVPFADPERAVGELPFHAVGFPLHKRVTAGDGRVVRDSAQIGGTIPLLADLKQGTLSLQLSGGGPRELPAGASPWEGMSGAAVFSNGALVGVVAVHRLPEGDATLAAVRIAAIDDPGLVPPAERDRFRHLLGLPPSPIAPLRADGGPASRQGVFLSLIDRHRVFGGREAELSRLTELAQAGHGGYLLVTGRSGVGKTALLANWARWRAAAGAATCVHFISRRDGTAGEEDTLVSLCEQLALARGVPAVSPASLPDLEDRYIRLITEPLPAGQRMVVVIDALDEAAWTPAPSLFPPPADGVLVVLSARERADLDWIDRLELPPGTPAITLGRLGPADVAEILASAGAPQRLRTPEAVEAIVVKSGGEPYYLAMLARDLKKGVLTVPAQLSRWPTGLRGYFDRWWNETVAVDPRGVIQLLAYLLAAVGPVPRDDLVDIDPGDALDAVSIDQVVERAQGQVVGDAEGGYQLAHPLFAEYLELHRIADADRAAAREALLGYCEGQLGSPTSYVLGEFPGLLSATGRVERLLELIGDPGWYAAQLAGDPSGGGYLADVRVAWEASHRRGAAELAGGGLPRWAGREMGCALAVASMRSRLSGIPPQLLRTLARQGRWSERSLLAAIRDAPTPRQHAGALEAIVADLSPAGLREALALARGLPLDLYQERSPRMSALAAATEHLAGDERAAAARELFALRPQVRDEREWLRFIARPQVSRALPGELVLEAVRAAADLDAEEQAAALVAAMHEAGGDAAVITALADIHHPGCLAEVITALAGRLGSEGTSAAARLAAELPAEGRSGSPRARALGALAPWLAPDDIAQAKRAVAAVADDGWRAWAELALAARRPAGDVADALRAAGELSDPAWRLRAVVAALPMLDGDHYEQALGIALGALAAAEHGTRAAAARALAAHLSAADAERALTALGAEPGTEELAVLAACLPDDRRIAVLTPQVERQAADLVSALRLIRLLPAAAAAPLLRRQLDVLTGEPAPRPAVVSAFAEHAPDDVLPTVRAAALRCRLSLDTWVRLLERSPAEDRGGDLLDAALGQARLADERDPLFEAARRAEALARLLPLAPPERFDDVLTEALAAAGVIADDPLRLRAEIALLAGLPADAQADIAARAAELAEDDRVRALRALDGPLAAPVVLHLIDLAEDLPSWRALGPLGRLRQVAGDPAGAEAADGALRRAIRRLPLPFLGPAVSDVPDDLLAEVLDVVAGLPPGDAIVETLIALAARVPQELRRGVVELIARLPDEPGPDTEPGRLSLRSRALYEAAPFLDADAAEQALPVAAQIRDLTSRVHAWVRVAARQAEPARSEAAAGIAESASGQPAAVVAQLISAFAAAAPESSADLVAAAFTAVRDRAGTDEEVAESLHLLSPFLAPADAAAALELTRRFAEPWRRLVAAGFVGRLADDQREAAIGDLLRGVEAFEREEERCDLLTALGAAAPAHLRGALLERALDEAAALGAEGTRLARRAVAAIDVPAQDAVALSTARLRDALAMDALIPAPPAAAIEPTLSLPLTGRPSWAPPRQSLGATRRMPSGAIGIRPDAASGLVSLVGGDTITPVAYQRRAQLPAPAQVSAFESALARLRRADGEAWRALVTRLLGDLPLGGPDVLTSVESALGRRVHRAIALQYLAPPLPVWFTPVPIAERARRETDRAARLLHEVIAALGTLDLTAQHETWNELLTAFSADLRPFFLLSLISMSPVTLRLGDGSGAQALAAIRFAGARWP